MNKVFSVYRLAAIGLFLIAAPSLVRATSVDEVNFQEMVRSSQQIFVGEVVDMTSFRADTAAGVRIRTRVTFRTSEPLLGAGPLVVLEFRGGTVGSLTEQVEGMPTFTVGDEYVVFARNGAQLVSPVIGLNQGLFKVSRDLRDGLSRVLTHDGLPVAATASVGRAPVRVSQSVIIPMPLASFVDAIQAELEKASRQ